MYTVFNFVQRPNTAPPIVLTLSGNVIDVIFVPANALCPTDFTVDGKFISVISEQYQNVSAGMPVIPSGISIAPFIPEGTFINEVRSLLYKIPLNEEYVSFDSETSMVCRESA